MTMDSAFTMLKKAREAKNLSLTDVADSTFIKLPPWVQSVYGVKD